MKVIAPLLSLFLCCLPQPRIIEAPVDVYLFPQEKQYKAEIIDLKPVKPPFIPDFDLRIEDNKKFKHWDFDVRYIKEYGLTTIINEDNLECSLIKEGPFQYHDLMSVYCASVNPNWSYLRTRAVGCARGTRDTTHSENEFITIYLSCDGIK